MDWVSFEFVLNGSAYVYYLNIHAVRLFAHPYRQLDSSSFHRRDFCAMSRMIHHPALDIHTTNDSSSGIGCAPSTRRMTHHPALDARHPHDERLSSGVRLCA